MKNKITGVLYPIVALLFWALAWQALALTIDLGFIFPRLDATLEAFFDLLFSSNFWQTIGASLLRILLGFFIGSAMGILIAPLTHYFQIARSIISPAMTVIKSTPVASFILVLWCLIGKSAVPTVIGILMVMPIVWQNLSDGFKSIDNELLEVCKVYNLAPLKQFRILIFPALSKFLLPALVTASALAWKSGIAAEIIVYAKNSIGQEIIDAKNFFQSELVFAWTMAVIVLSILIELGIKKMAKAVKNI